MTQAMKEAVECEVERKMQERFAVVAPLIVAFRDRGLIDHENARVCAEIEDIVCGLIRKTITEVRGVRRRPRLGLTKSAPRSPRK